MAKRRSGRPRVFTVGYATLAPAELRRLVLALDVTLIDVRSRPSGRVKKGFSRKELERLLGVRYEWRGELGGFGPGPTAAGLARLAADPRRLLLMCSEAIPADCHRHGIALHLAGRGVAVWHVFEQEVIDATELQRAIDDGDEYEFTPLAEVLAAVKPG